jgi:hypothetical protein
MVDWSHHHSGGKVPPYHRADYYKASYIKNDRNSEKMEDKKYENILSRAHDLTVIFPTEEDDEGDSGSEGSISMNTNERDKKNDSQHPAASSDNGYTMEHKNKEGSQASVEQVVELIGSDTDDVSPYGKYQRAQQTPLQIETQVKQGSPVEHTDLGSHSSSPTHSQVPIPVPFLNRPINGHRSSPGKGLTTSKLFEPRRGFTSQSTGQRKDKNEVLISNDEDPYGDETVGGFKHLEQLLNEAGEGSIEVTRLKAVMRTIMDRRKESLRMLQSAIKTSP